MNKERPNKRGRLHADGDAQELVGYGYDENGQVVALEEGVYAVDDQSG